MHADRLHIYMRFLFEFPVNLQARPGHAAVTPCTHLVLVLAGQYGALDFTGGRMQTNPCSQFVTGHTVTLCRERERKGITNIDNGICVDCRKWKVCKTVKDLLKL